jgi:site-specific DNA-methyltransferase (adenine-specific)
MNDVEVWQGDCRELMARIPEGGVDAIVTDPPYGIRYSPGDGGSPWTNGVKTFAGDDLIVGDDRPFDPSPLLAFGVPTILWGANHYADRLPPRPSWLVWDKRDGSTSNDFADCEMAWCSEKMPARLFSHRWQGAFRDSERGKPRLHPTQKPLALMMWCLSFLPKDITVLDPFAGSGTTGVACMKTGRRAILMEVDPRYIPVIHRRLRDAATPLFDSLGAMS